MSATDLQLLRPAIEAALAVARRGEADDPPVPAPPLLRPFLSFARLPAAALAVARRVLDDDEGFRARVRAAIDETDVGPVGWLWLERPEGWAEALAEAAAASAAAGPGSSADQGAARDPRGHGRRRAAGEAAAARAEGRVRQAVEEQERLRQQASELRRANRTLAAELERTEAQLVSLTEDRTATVRQLKAVEASLGERVAESRRHRDDAETARRQLAEAEAALARLDAERTVPIGSGPDEAGPVATDAAAAIAPAPAGIDLPRAARLVSEAAEAAGRLAGALADLANLAGALLPQSTAGTAAVVGEATAAPGDLATAPADFAPGHLGARPANRATRAGDSATGSVDLGTPPGAGRAVTGGGSAAASADAAPVGVVRRRPVRLARGAADDTPAGADDLARLDGVIFLVDGYNVSMTGWPDLDLAAQRLRLVNAAAELRARLGTHVEVVFDGQDEGQAPFRTLPAAVRVWFTAVGVEADDLVLSLVERQPPERPVVVVSSDRRVRDGAAQRGASVLSSSTFLCLLR